MLFPPKTDIEDKVQVKKNPKKTKTHISWSPIKSLSEESRPDFKRTGRNSTQNPYSEQGVGHQAYNPTLWRLSKRTAMSSRQALATSDF